MWQHVGQKTKKIVGAIIAQESLATHMSLKGMFSILFVLHLLVTLVCLRIKRPPDARLITIVHRVGEVCISIF